jgi:hypothetical protein
LYGPSEDTTYSTFAPVERRSTLAPLIGRPIAATRACVVDRRGQPAPLGVAGELWRGPGTWLPGTPRPDGGTVCPRPVFAGRRGAPVPHRGPGALAAARRVGVPRAA